MFGITFTYRVLVVAGAVAAQHAGRGDLLRAFTGGTSTGGIVIFLILDQRFVAGVGMRVHRRSHIAWMHFGQINV